MLALGLPPTDEPLRVLALGAHSDDIELGAGGTLLRVCAERKTTVRAVVFSADGDRRDEAEAGANALYADAVDAHLDVHHFRENLFPDAVADLKRTLGSLHDFEPQLVLTHRRHDRHQDHYTIGDLTWQAFRDHLVVQYEIPKWEGDLITPNCYVELPESVLDRKIEIIATVFGSQAAKQWFDADTIRGLARLRGVECARRFAEGFHAEKMLLAAAPGGRAERENS